MLCMLNINEELMRRCNMHKKNSRRARPSFVSGSLLHHITLSSPSSITCGVMGNLFVWSGLLRVVDFASNLTSSGFTRRAVGP